MKPGRIAAGMLSGALLALPAAAEDPPATTTPVAATPTPAAPAAAPANTGRLYVSFAQQPHDEGPSQLALDDAWLANAVAPGTCIYFDLPPGSHSVRTLADKPLSVDLAAGDSKYVELLIRRIYVEGHPQETVFPKLGVAPADTSACQHTDAPV